MKKFLACVSVLCLLCTCAFAYGSPYEEIWFDFEATTWPNSFYMIEPACVDICVPDPLVPQELNDANIAHGIVAMFMTDIGECMYVSLSTVYDENGNALPNLIPYQQYLHATNPNVTDSQIYLLNGVAALIYTDTDLDEKYVSFFALNNPCVLVTVTFTHASSHPKFMEMTAETIPGIMPYTY